MNLDKYEFVHLLPRLTLPPSVWERRAQYISWVVRELVANYGLRDRDVPADVEWEARWAGAEAWEARQRLQVARPPGM